MADQVLDRADLQPVLAGEHFQLRPPRHAAVGVEDLDQHAGRLKPGKHGQVRRRIGRSEEHTSELQPLMRTSYAVFCVKKNYELHSLMRISYSAYHYEQKPKHT